MELIKRHKGLAIVGGLSLILIIILFAIFARMLFSGSNSVYGDRLQGITKIESSVIKDVKSKISDSDGVEEVTVRTQGKIVYTTIIFSEKTSKDKAKEIATKSLEYYDEDVLEDYDFEFLLTQNIEVDEDEEDPSFYIAGTKHPDKEEISWTKD